MKNYDKMVSLNKLLSSEKVRRAINAIIDMEEEKRVFCVSELVRRTGLSRTFFYKNAKVREELDRTLKRYREIGLRDQRMELINGALQARIKLIEKKMIMINEKNAILEEENIKLKRVIEQLELEYIKLL